MTTSSPTHAPADVVALTQASMELHKTGRLEDAEKGYLDVLAVDPNFGHAHRLLGALYLQRAQNQLAEPHLQKALVAFPNNAEILANLGLALSQQGKQDETIIIYERILKTAPDNVDVLNKLGALYWAVGRLDQTATCFEAVIRLEPQNAETYLNLGMTRYVQNRVNDAIGLYEKALALRPAFAEAWTSLGAAYWAIHRLDDAVRCHEEALRIRPDYTHALVELGCSLMAQGKLDEAELKYNEALKIQSGHPEAFSNLGALYQAKGNPQTALDFLDKALQIDAHHKHAQFEKSMALLALGRYREGWALYDAGLGKPSWRGEWRFSSPPWDGKPMPGKRLLIWSEQGFGDSIQFVRYAQLCKERVGQVFIMCPKPLHRLFKTCEGVDGVYETMNASDFDAHIPMMSLPRLFDTTLEIIPASIPYLSVDADSQKKWANDFENKEGFKVGLVWAGNAHMGKLNNNLVDQRRSLTLPQISPILECSSVHFYSLQMGDARKQLERSDLRARIIDLMGRVDDFMDTAALIQNLDLIVTVDTSVAHLAGALGKAVWVLSRYDADWRWLQNRETNPWYPTARIFGQSALGNWDEPILEAKEALRVISSKT